MREFLAALRQYHALEHATIAVLYGKTGGRRSFLGHVTARGFCVHGEATKELVEEAAREALERLQSGERELAISPFCGANLALAAVLVGIAAALALRGKNKAAKFPKLLIFSALALLASRFLGELLQKHLLTSSDLTGVRIEEVVEKERGRRWEVRVSTPALRSHP